MPKTMTISDAEETLRSIASTASNEMRVPTQGKHLHAGGEAAMVQAHISWARDRDHARLKTWVIDENDADGQIRSLSRQFFGLSAILLSNEILDRSGRNITEHVRNIGFERLRMLQSERPRFASRGPQYEIICADHLDEGSPRLLYSFNEEGEAILKGNFAFETIADQIIHTILPARLMAGLDDGFKSSLGAALYELFRNTDEHARVDDKRLRLRRSLRGIQARLHSISPAALAGIVAKSPPLASFVNRLTPAHANAAQIQLVEVSVIDSGPGLGPAHSGCSFDQLSRADEFIAVKACFAKHATRKNSSSAGLGLPNLIDVLRERGGFLRVRTGRQALFADLSLEADRTYDDIPDLQQWFGNPQSPAPALGTLMTFLLPLSRYP